LIFFYCLGCQKAPQWFLTGSSAAAELGRKKHCNRQQFFDRRCPQGQRTLKNKVQGSD